MVHTCVCIYFSQNKVFDAKEQLTKLGAKDDRLAVGAGKNGV